MTDNFELINESFAPMRDLCDKLEELGLTINLTATKKGFKIEIEKRTEKLTHCKWYPNCNKECVEPKNHNPLSGAIPVRKSHKSTSLEATPSDSVGYCSRPEGTSKSKGCGKEFKIGENTFTTCDEMTKCPSCSKEKKFKIKTLKGGKKTNE